MALQLLQLRSNGINTRVCLQVRYDSGSIYWMAESKLRAAGASATQPPSTQPTRAAGVQPSSSPIELDVDSRSNLPYDAVDCVVTPWGAWQAAEASNTNHPKLARERFAMEAPAYGGAACPSLIESKLACSKSPGGGGGGDDDCAGVAEAIDTGGMREMIAFLRTFGFEKHIDLFVSEQVEIDVAMTLSETDFSNLGMSLEESKRILLELGRQRERDEL